MAKKKKEIIDILKKLDFVMWDRYSGEGENLIFYGWISREKDLYKDFICIEFNEEELSFMKQVVKNIVRKYLKF